MLHGDFMAIPAADSSIDAAHQIEALSHALDKTSAYAEKFRVLRPGAVFVGHDWCMTPLYDSGDPAHRELKQGIEYGNALPAIASFDEVANSLRAAGFEGIETHDRTLDADPATPWYRPLAGRALTLRGSLGRRLTSTALRVLESVGAVPRGSCAVCQFLNVAADSLATAGLLGIFTPMYFHKARKPG